MSCIGSGADRIWRSLIASDGLRCHWCGEKVKRGVQRADGATLDHLKPRSHGGSNELSNLVIACKSCNERRGTTPPEAFRRYMDYLRGWVPA